MKKYKAKDIPLEKFKELMIKNLNHTYNIEHTIQEWLHIYAYWNKNGFINANLTDEIKLELLPYIMSNNE